MNTATNQNAAGSAAGSPVLSAVADVLKLQILLTAFSHASPATAIFLLLLATAYEAANMHLPHLTGAIWNAIKADDNPAQAIQPTADGPRACIQFERTQSPSGLIGINSVRESGNRAPDMRIEAVLAHVCSLPAARSLRFGAGEFIPNFKGALEVDTDIWFELVRAPGASGATSQAQQQAQDIIRYRLFSNDHDITHIHRFIDRTIETYEQEKKNKLGSETYYFDQITNVTDGRYTLPTPNGFCAFKKSKFLSNRSLRNVYFPQMDMLADRIDFFMKRRDWYDEKGIPHTLGIVMHGHPGCGKTSTIKAIATATRRHIFNISLSQIKTREALKDLFYNDVIHLFNGERLETLTIPIRQRLYVIEDIDAMDSVVIKRGAKQTAEQAAQERNRRAAVEERKKMMRDLGREDEIIDDELDLATLLNVLDGVRETPGRILVLSTNYPERLDEALLRPGRFDMILEYKKHSIKVLTRHMEDFYGTALTQEQIDELWGGRVEGKWTPAEVSQILFKNMTDIDAAIMDLVTGSPENMFKYSRMNERADRPIEGWGGERWGCGERRDGREGGRCCEYSPPRAISPDDINELDENDIFVSAPGPAVQSEADINEFLPANELQSEMWSPYENKRSAFGLPHRKEFPAPFNGETYPSLMTFMPPPDRKITPSALSPSSALANGPPKGPHPTMECDLIINKINASIAFENAQEAMNAAAAGDKKS